MIVISSNLSPVDKTLAGLLFKKKETSLPIIGAKEYNAIATAAGREALRAECRARVADILANKKGGPVIQDLLFTNYIYQ